MAAPLGNKNGSKSRVFEQALTREIKARDFKDGDGETLRKIAGAMIDKAMELDLQAIKEIRDTLDGKPAQSTIISGDPENPVGVSVIERIIVDPK